MEYDGYEAILVERQGRVLRLTMNRPETLNAIDATPAGGSVTVSANRRGMNVEFCVDDQGAGVPHEQRDHIFQPFFSTRADRPGGLGLAISRRLIEEVGGWIEVGDAPSGGARFRVFLPVEPNLW